MGVQQLYRILQRVHFIRGQVLFSLTQEVTVRFVKVLYLVQPKHQRQLQHPHRLPPTPQLRQKHQPTHPRQHQLKLQLKVQ